MLGGRKLMKIFLVITHSTNVAIGVTILLLCEAGEFFYCFSQRIDFGNKNAFEAVEVGVE